MTASTTYNTLLQRSESILPAEFYDVRQETTPKAGWAPMYAFAGFAYVGAIIAFAVIFASESSKATTETVISSTDNTGQSGYTCEMISKVTAAYEVPSVSGYDPAQAFQLINVIESNAKYEADYDLSDPCAQPLEFFPGEITPVLQNNGVVYGAGVFYGDDAVYYLASTGDGALLMRLNITNGAFFLDSFDVLTESIAVDAEDRALLLSSNGEDHYAVYRFVPDFASRTFSREEIYTVTSSFEPIILNDNLYNIYLAEHDTFTALDVDSGINGTASNTTLFTTRDGEFIRYAAVYNSGSSVKVYYVNNTGGANVWEGGAITELGGQRGCVGIAVDGKDRLLYLFAEDNSLVLTNSTGTELAYIFTASNVGGVAMMANGARALIIEDDRGLNFAFNTAAWDDYVDTQLVYARQGFAVGYFTCGDKVLNSTQFQTYDDTAYTTVCAENGVVAQVTFVNSYTFTTTDVETYAYLHGPSHCAALTDPISLTIADLPPYSCSRTIHPSFLACFATAAANTQLLFQVLVFVSALALSKLASRYPPKHSLRVTTPITPCAVEMTGMGVGKAQEHDVENPMGYP